MSNVLVIAQTTPRSLHLATHKTVSAALALAPDQLELAVIGANQTVVNEATHLDGVTRVMAVDCQPESVPIAQQHGQTLAELVKRRGYTHLFGPATAFGKDLLPVIAARLGVDQISDMIRVIDRTHFVRAIYAGHVITRVAADAHRPIVASVRITAWPAVSARPDHNVPVEEIRLSSPPLNHTRICQTQERPSAQRDLQTAQRVVAAGRGVGSAANFQHVIALANALNAAVGTSRAAVDAGYANNALQIGQTGRAIAPDLYLAFGISGAIQHVSGIQDAGTIVAINTDPEAPIFEIADIGLVADMMDVLPVLTQTCDRSNA